VVSHGAIRPRRKLESGVETDRLLTFHWIEKDVCLLSAGKNGLRAHLLRSCLPHQLGAKGEINFDSEGLKARIGIPLA
jgi:hypothetical protein